MALTFEFIKELTTDENNADPKYVDSPAIIAEPDSRLFQYFLNNTKINGKEGSLTDRSYAVVPWKTPIQLVSTQPAKQVGYKHVPHIGAIAFFKDEYLNHSFVLAPVHADRKLAPAPTAEAVVEGNTLKITVSSSLYDCYRVVLRSGVFAEEHVSYDPTFSVKFPVVKGDYAVLLIGYHEKDNRSSLPLTLTSITVTEGADTWDPPTQKMPTKLSDLTDVNIAELLNEQLLAYDATTGRWYNKTIPDGDKEVY